jgi:hypothetical protein
MCAGNKLRGAARALLILPDANIYGRDSNQMNVNQLINSARESIPLLGIMASVGQLCDARLSETGRTLNLDSLHDVSSMLASECHCCALQIPNAT